MVIVEEKTTEVEDGTKTFLTVIALTEASCQGGE